MVCFTVLAEESEENHEMQDMRFQANTEGLLGLSAQ
jgi:hypothetical protein